MKILLVSPIDPEKRTKLKLLVGGENTYTRMLLANPPKHVQFVYFTEALKNRDISFSWKYFLFLYLQKFRILLLGPRIYAFNIKSDFDLIYAHAHPIQTNKKIPLIISNSSSDIVFSKYYQKLPEWKIRILQIVKYYIFQIFNIIDAEVNPQNTQIFVFSNWAKKIKRNLGIQNSDVIYPGLSLKSKQKKFKNTNKVKILFAGVWFERKGGRILLNVFRALKLKYPQIQLTILGELPKDIQINQSEAIEQYDFVSYSKLKYFYKTHNILVHIPPEIEGYGMVVPESMAYGMAIIVSKICVLPEFIEHQKSGLVIKPNSEIALEEALEKLIINPGLRKTLGRNASLRFQKQFSLAVFQKKLFNLFSQVIKNNA